MTARTGTDPLGWLAGHARERAAAGLRRALRPRPAGGDGLLDLASNDYLGLSRDPGVVAAGVDALRTWGAGATGSRLVTGSTDLHAALEAGLAAHVGTPAALVLSSGYLANLAAVTALSGPGSLVVSDAGNHASLVDACRLSRARVVVVPHGDVAAVEAALGGRAEERAVVVTDAVFSVDGAAAPLVDLHAVARRHGAVLVADDAHGLGVVGPRGEGAVAAAGLAEEPDVVITVTLSKALASQGGAVLGRADVVAHLVDAARPFIFDTGLAPVCAATAAAALARLRAEPDLATRVRARAADLAAAATAAGLSAVARGAAVVAVPMGTPDAAVAGAATAAAAGVRVGCFRPPSVPVGGSCLRLTARADLSEADLARVRSSFGHVAAGGAGAP